MWTTDFDKTMELSPSIIIPSSWIMDNKAHMNNFQDQISFHLKPTANKVIAIIFVSFFFHPFVSTVNFSSWQMKICFEITPFTLGN